MLARPRVRPFSALFIQGWQHPCVSKRDTMLATVHVPSPRGAQEWLSHPGCNRVLSRGFKPWHGSSSVPDRVGFKLTVPVNRQGISSIMKLQHVTTTVVLCAHCTLTVAQSEKLPLTLKINLLLDCAHYHAAHLQMTPKALLDRTQPGVRCSGPRSGCLSESLSRGHGTVDQSQTSVSKSSGSSHHHLRWFQV